MRKGASNFSRNPSNRIDEEAEHDDDTSSGSDYENQLIPAPSTVQSKTGPKASSNLFDAELGASGDATNNSDAEDDARMNEDDDNYVEEVDQDKDEIIRERIAQSQEQMKHILELLSEDQLKRYETFRRVGFPRPAIRKLMSKVLDQQVNMNSVIVVSGIAKVFVGELVEEARKVMDDLGESGQIMPSHLLEAHRRLKAANLAPAASIYKRKRNRLL
jgi:transcription initiation factor TFIID subunit 11